IQFFARVYKLCFCCGAQSFAPKVRRRDVNFVARPARQTRALQLRNVRRRSLFRVEVGVAGREKQIGDRLGPQFRLQSLRFGCAEVERVEQPVKSNHVRQVIMKISRTQSDAPATAGPEPLFDTDIPPEIFLRLQSKIIPENLVLTARRTEPGCDARVQSRVCLVDFVTAGKLISPDVTELIKVIEPPTRDEDQVFDRRRSRLQKVGCFLGVIAYKGRLRPKNLQNKGSLLAGIDPAVKKT